MIGDKASLQNKWFVSDMHAQITADAYDLFVLMISSSSNQVLVRAPSSFRSAEKIRAALHTARLLGSYLVDPAAQGIGTL